MNKFSLILSAIVMLAMVVVIAPGIFALNKQHMLRNIALWLGIFAGLGLIYQNFGPGSAHPMFGFPAGEAMKQQRQMRMNGGASFAFPGKSDTDKTNDSKNAPEQNFTPPRD